MPPDFDPKEVKVTDGNDVLDIVECQDTTVKGIPVVGNHGGEWHNLATDGGGNLQVDVVGALPSGTNEVGKFKLTDGANEVDVLTCNESGNKAIPVVKEYPGDQKSHDHSQTGIANGATATTTCTAVTNGKTGHLEQVILAVEGGPTRCLVKQDGAIIGIFYLGGHIGTSVATSHLADSKVWPCDFSGLHKIVGDGSKVWTVDFKNICGVAMTVDVSATFVWREV